MIYDQCYTNYQTKKRSKIRQWIRDIYLNASLRLSEGLAIDFGCGPGELLQKLPPGSVGLDINPNTVEYCLKKGLNVQLYDPEKDKFNLNTFTIGKYNTLILCHVLEHIAYPEKIFRLLLKSAQRLRIKKIIVIVPGKKGFHSDKTHITYIDYDFFQNHNLLEIEGYKIITQCHFPVNIKFFGHFFTHFELHLVYRSISC
jgi:SAM-dependent methyltransferase